MLSQYLYIGTYPSGYLLGSYVKLERLTHLMGENHFSVKNEEKWYFVFEFWNPFFEMAPRRKIWVWLCELNFLNQPLRQILIKDILPVISFSSSLG